MDSSINRFLLEFVRFAFSSSHLCSFGQILFYFFEQNKPSLFCIFCRKCLLSCIWTHSQNWYLANWRTFTFHLVQILNIDEKFYHYLYKLACPPVKSAVVCHKVCFLGCGGVSLKKRGCLANCTKQEQPYNYSINKTTLCIIITIIKTKNVYWGEEWEESEKTITYSIGQN